MGRRGIIGGERTSLYIAGGRISAAESCACMPILQGISNCTASSCRYWTVVQTREVMSPLSPAKVSCGTACVATQPSRILQSSMHQVTSCSSLATQDLGVWASLPMFFLPPSIIIFPPPTWEYLPVQTTIPPYKHTTSFYRAHLPSIPSWVKFFHAACPPFHPRLRRVLPFVHNTRSSSYINNINAPQQCSFVIVTGIAHHIPLQLNAVRSIPVTMPKRSIDDTEFFYHIFVMFWISPPYSLS